MTESPDGINSHPSPSPVAKRSDEKHCHACGRLIHLTAQACPHCGAMQETTTSSSIGLPFVGQFTRGLSAGQVFCRGCGIGIHQSASACPHCGAPQIAGVQQATDSPRNGSSWPAIISLVLGSICILALADDSDWDSDTLVGYFGFAISGLIFGAAALFNRTSVRGLAVAGVVLSAIALLAGFGLL